MKPLTSVAYDVSDLEEAIELYYQRGWTDGLPVVPPTEERVTRFLEVVRREPDEVLGVYPARRRVVTVEKVAINAVMAGCLPEYFPVVLALMEALLDPQFGVHVSNSTTGGAALGYIVNGPIRNMLQMNYRGNVLGPGNRANSTIGRAIRLVQINALGSIGGAGGEDDLAGKPVLDRSTIGQPGKYACYHYVENEEDYPSLNPLHVELGFRREQSVATLFSTGGHVQISTHAEHSAEQIVDTIAEYLVGSGRLTAVGGNAWCVVVLPPENTGYIVKDRWSKADISRALFEKTTRTIKRLKENGWIAANMVGPGSLAFQPGDEEQKVAIAGSPKNIYVVLSGGPAGGFVHYLLPYGGPLVSKVIKE